MSKLEQLRIALQAQDTSAMIITNAQNRRYLTGFTGSAGTVVVTNRRALLLVDFRYTQQATEQSKTFEVHEIDRNRIYETIQEILDQDSIQSVGFEQHHVTYYALSING